MGVLRGCKCCLLSFSEFLDRRSRWVGAAWMVRCWGAVVVIYLSFLLLPLIFKSASPTTHTHTYRHTRAHPPILPGPILQVATA